LKVDLVADDNPAIQELCGLSVLHPGLLRQGLPASFEYLVAIGDNPTRERLFHELQRLGGIA
jgi:hypothetical protein